jgi:hypothetical protein
MRVVGVLHHKRRGVGVCISPTPPKKWCETRLCNNPNPLMHTMARCKVWCNSADLSTNFSLYRTAEAMRE